MHILVLGAAGMVGRKLTAALSRGRLPAYHRRASRSATSSNRHPGEGPAATKALPAIFAAGAAEVLIADKPDLIFHLAAIVSGEAEVDCDKGYRINLDVTRMLLEAIRHQNGGIRLQAPVGVHIDDCGVRRTISGRSHRRRILPHAAVELRHPERRSANCCSPITRAAGFMDGIGIRLPTIWIRPGLPNKAASESRRHPARAPARPGVDAAGRRRTPATGRPSPRRGRLLLTPLPRWTRRRSWARAAILTMPGLSATVGEEIAALKRAAADNSASP